MRVHVFGSTRPGNSLINLARTSEDLALSAFASCKVDAVFFAFGTNSNTVPLSTNRAIFIRPPSNTVFFGGGAELSNKIEELDRSNNDLNNLLESTQIATVFLDRNLVIRSFTPAVTKIFSLIPSDRGRPLTDIVSPIAHQDLQTDVHAVFERGEVIERGIRLVDGEEHYLVRRWRIAPARHAAGGRHCRTLHGASCALFRTEHQLLKNVRYVPSS
jgi:PAS domain-containing protein